MMSSHRTIVDVNIDYIDLLLITVIHIFIQHEYAITTVDEACAAIAHLISRLAPESLPYREDIMCPL
jgi:hypothetical protein